MKQTKLKKKTFDDLSKNTHTSTQRLHVINTHTHTQKLTKIKEQQQQMKAISNENKINLVGLSDDKLIYIYKKMIIRNINIF